MNLFGVYRHVCAWLSAPKLVHICICEERERSMSVKAGSSEMTALSRLFSLPLHVSLTARNIISRYCFDPLLLWWGHCNMCHCTVLGAVTEERLYFKGKWFNALNKAHSISDHLRLSQKKLRLIIEELQKEEACNTLEVENRAVVMNFFVCACGMKALKTYKSGRLSYLLLYGILFCISL